MHQTRVSHHRGPYRSEERERYTREVVQRRAAGETWTSIAADLGIRPITLQRWCEGRGTPSFAPVVIEQSITRPALSAPMASAGGQVVLITPGGFRIEGLRIPELIAVMEALR